MKRFLAVFLGSPTSARMAEWNALDPKTRGAREKEGMLAWQNWMIKNQKSVVEGGGPLGKTKQVNARGVSDIKNMMAAFTVVEAEDHQQAAKMFEGHPHFTIFPGESVEVMECLPIPTMK